MKMANHELRARNGRGQDLSKAARIGAAFLSVRCARSAQQRLQPGAGFQPTAQDVPPGVDHGNVSEDLPETFQRRAVFYRSQHPVGTIIIETGERHLYLIESETRALRYGIGVGREGFAAAGLFRITRKSPMAGLGAVAGSNRTPALPSARHSRRRGQSARRPRHGPRQPLPHPRHQCAGNDRPGAADRLLPPRQR